MIQIHYGNRLEQLVGSLTSLLFAPETGPFTRRLVVVPTQAMRKWLQRAMASDPERGIAAGIDFFFLEQLVGRLIPDGIRVPDRLELTLRIEVLLRAGNWEGIESHLRSDRRIGYLARHLAELILDYGVYGAEVIEGGSDWQSELWDQIHSSGCTSLPRAMERAVLPEGDDLQIHLFGFSYLPPIYDQFFERMSEACAIHYHVLSPCAAYWGDIRSDRERGYLTRFFEGKGIKEGELAQLDALLRDTNPLIANWGRLGRRFFHMLEEGEALSSETYEEPEADFLLGAVQRDILTLRNPDEQGPIELASADRSIQVHVATSRWREVQVLYDALLGLLDGGGISPGDVVVMAPDISLYSPVIEAVFGGSELPFQLHDLRMAAEGSVVEGLSALVNLGTSRWSVSVVLAVLEHPAVGRRMGWGTEEIQQFRSWIRTSGVRWGRDVSHRDDSLKEAYGSRAMVERGEGATWRGGVSRLLRSLIEGTDGPSLVEFSDVELLGRFVEFLESLSSDLEPLRRNVERPLEEWCSYLECLTEAYLWPAEGEEGVIDRLIGRIRRIVPSFQGERFSFWSVRRLLESLMSEATGVVHSREIDGVKFCSLLPMRAIPSRVVCLLGIDERSFPRIARRRPFDLLQSEGVADPSPQAPDVDRYLFLEALVSARDAFLIFYQGVSSEDGEAQGPSAVVEELVGYLDRSYRIGGEFPSEVCLLRHPYLPFHASYFSREGGSYSERDYRAACALYGEQEELGDVSAVRFPELEGVVEIDVADLRATATDPCRHYLARQLGMEIEEEWSGGLSDIESFGLSALEQHRLVWEGLRRPMEEVLAVAEEEGVLPLGAFRQLAIDRLEGVVEEYRERLREYGVNELLSLELTDAVRGVERLEGEILAPPLEIQYSDNLVVRIKGEVPCVTPQGLFVNGRGEVDYALRAWPMLLVASLAAGGNVGEHILFSKKTQIYPRVEGDARAALRSYLRYHLLCSGNLSPLLPRWLPDYLEERFDQLQKRVHSDLSEGNGGYASSYVRWVVERGHHEPSAIDGAWREAYEGAFGAPLREWFGGEK